jgi:hypothetical protein
MARYWWRKLKADLTVLKTDKDFRMLCLFWAALILLAEVGQ